MTPKTDIPEFQTRPNLEILGNVLDELRMTREERFAVITPVDLILPFTDVDQRVSRWVSTRETGSAGLRV